LKLCNRLEYDTFYSPLYGHTSLLLCSKGISNFMSIMMHTRWPVELDFELKVLEVLETERGLNGFGVCRAAQMAKWPARQPVRSPSLARSSMADVAYIKTFLNFYSDFPKKVRSGWQCNFRLPHDTLGRRVL
jgi:hypothetical protein